MGYFSILRFLAVLCVMLIGVVGMSGVTQAQDILGVFENELPQYDSLGKREFYESSEVFTKTPIGDDALAYRVVVPKDWKSGKDFAFSLSTRVMTEIGAFTGPVKFNKASSYLTIEALGLDYQTTTREWFLREVLKNGYSVQGAKIFSPNHIEVLYVTLIRGETYIVRTALFINAGRLVRISYFLPQTSWKEERSLQNRVVASFSLMNALNNDYVDAQDYDFLDVASFSYPNSWQFKESNKKSLDSMSATLVNYDEVRLKSGKRVSNGSMYVRLFSKYVVDSVEKEIEKYIDEMISQGIVIQREYPDLEDNLRLAPSMNKSYINRLDVIDSRYPNRETELWLVGMEAGDYYYMATLLTPAEEKYFNLWTQNIKAFEFLLGSLKPNLD